MKTKVLIVDDEKDIIEMLQYNLENQGYEVVYAYDGLEALDKLKENPALIVLDIMMPKLDGYQTLKKIRETKGFENIPIMILSAKSGEIDEIKSLNIGADDFVQKPISPNKLIARINSNLRKVNIITSQQQKHNHINIGPIEIDREKFTVLVDKENIFMPKKEFEILCYLASNPGKVFPREQILSDVWGNDIYVVERTIDVHVRKIREKLDKYADLIETVKGVGYRFK
ncbi:MAG TPA: response regulator transcription factor, partial [Melioribacteraceae bacterium]|nr:response regulator transcription factor [Melioribacteraceae bacterium]